MTSISTKLTTMLGINFPVIMAPMFLVSNEAMVTEAMKSGICGAFPSLNYRKNEELIAVLESLNHKNPGLSGTYGVNLIVQKSNPFYQSHLEICISHKVPVIITSLGDPAETITKSHTYGGKVFCDVTNIEHARKCVKAGCDGLIAVGAGAGGHAGPNALHILVRALTLEFPEVPVIAAGGIADGHTLLSMIAAGASGASIGTLFIATHEAGVKQPYKDAIVSSGIDDIVMTEKISGTPCTVINTPFAKKIGYRQNFLEKWLSKNKRTRKYFKMIIQMRGFKFLEKSAYTSSYDQLWCAGQSVELIHSIHSCADVIESLKSSTEKAWTEMKGKVS